MQAYLYCLFSTSKAVVDHLVQYSWQSNPRIVRFQHLHKILSFKMDPKTSCGLMTIIIYTLWMQSQFLLERDFLERPETWLKRLRS